MFFRKKSLLPGEFSVSVNPNLAFSILYEDDRGKLTFVFEVDDVPKTVYLNSTPSQNGKLADVRDIATKARVDIAVDRVKAYFEKGGLTVKLD